MDAKERMLRMLSKGKVPDMADLKLGREEFVKLVAEVQAEGLIEGVYISFCDSQDASHLLSGARLTEKGREKAGRKSSFFRR